MTELYRRSITGFILGLIVVSSLFFAPSWVFAAIAASILLYVLVYEWPLLFRPSEPAFWLLMPLYPIVPFLLIIQMQLSGYEIMNVLLIALVAGHDSGAYLVGKMWGKHKIWPSVSPSKTWEGFIGGCMLAYLFSLIFFHDQSMSTQLTVIVPLVVLISFCALLGDLFESYLKRRAGVKDAGALLPGHGGILDRIDGILFASVAVYLLKNSCKLLLHQP